MRTDHDPDTLLQLSPSVTIAIRGKAMQIAWRQNLKNSSINIRRPKKTTLFITS
jgi:hypothetical protein